MSRPNTAISYLQIHDTIYKTAYKLKLVGIKPHIFSLQRFKVLLFILRRPLLCALEFKDMLIFEIYIINKLLRSTLYVCRWMRIECNWQRYPKMGTYPTTVFHALYFGCRLKSFAYDCIVTYSIRIDCLQIQTFL